MPLDPTVIDGAVNLPIQVEFAIEQILGEEYEGFLKMGYGLARLRNVAVWKAFKLNLQTEAAQILRKAID